MENVPEIGVRLLVYPRAQLSAVLGLTDLFNSANLVVQRRHGERNLQQFAVSHWYADDHGLECKFGDAAVPPSILILPPCLNAQELDPSAFDLLEWIKQQHHDGVLVCSVCAGAFVLAETELLNSRPATTHWALHEKFAEMFPEVHVDSEKMIIDDGSIITAGGVMAWIDLGLRIVDRFLGADVMQDLAKLLVVDAGHREQQFYSLFSPKFDHGDGYIVKVQNWMQGHYTSRVSIPQMASIAGMGERTFMRRFRKATGMSPTTYMQSLRVAKARELLELSVKSVKQIAWDVGYEDASAFNKVFRGLMGLSPSQYRRRFSLNEPAQV
ncbi:MAG: GlxA family transcriptional regulator [Hyphomicrobiales bacterium]